jgi:succinate dehydrogenase/fumarate reductase flavoprotein subunit
VYEACNYRAFGEAAREKGVTKAWMISDSIAVAKYGIGMAKPAPFSPKPWVRKGYLIQAATIDELARAIGLEPARLEETIRRFNSFAELGQDPDFNRGADDYSAYMGDPFHKPNPSLGPLKKGPFYALEIRPCDLSTLAGLSTNAHAQVLRATGDPIGGLYAVGLDNNSLFRGRYPGGGASIGPAMTFGYIAARHIAQQPYSPGKWCG